MGKLQEHTAASSGKRRLFFTRLGWIGTAALLLRFAASAELLLQNGGKNSAISPASVTDMATYLKLADDILNGSFALPFYYQPFYYAVFLPVIRFFSTSPWVLAFCQSLLGAGACIFAGLTAAQLFNRRAGLWTAGICAVSSPLLLYTPFAMNETLQSFNFALLAYLGVRLLQKDSWKTALQTGAVWGIATLTRGNALLFGLILLPLLVYKRAWKSALAALVMCIAVQSPFILANSLHLKKFSSPSTAADAVLALGNTPEAPPGGRNPGLPAGPMEYPETYTDFMARCANRSVPLQMLDFLQREPAAFLELQFRKVLLFWTGDEIPNNVSLYGEGANTRILSIAIPGRSFILLPLAIAGMLVCLPRLRQGRWLWLYGLVVIYWGATALFYDLSRFRAPILPAAFVFAGCFAERSIMLYHRKRPLLKAVILPLVLGIFLVNGAYTLYRQNLEAAMHRFCRPDGIIYQKQDGTTLQLDHGPFSFGDWQTLPLEAGMTLHKRFAGSSGEKTVTLQWTFYLPPGGHLRGSVNGKSFELNQPGMAVLKEDLTLANGTAILYIESASQDTFALLDLQRFYGRSSADMQIQPGEFITRINY